MPKDEEIRQLLDDPSLSDWFKRALLSALGRDPVDSANDADLLAVVPMPSQQAVAAARNDNPDARDRDWNQEKLWLNPQRHGLYTP